MKKTTSSFDSYEERKMTSEEENALLKQIVVELHWMAFRYADGRSTFVPDTFNRLTEQLIGLGVEIVSRRDGNVFARDGMADMFQLSKEKVALEQEVKSNYNVCGEVDERSIINMVNPKCLREHGHDGPHGSAIGLEGAAKYEWGYSSLPEEVLSDPVKLFDVLDSV